MQEVVPELISQVPPESGEELEIRVADGCPINDWSIRAYDPADLSRPGDEVSSDRQDTGGVEWLTFSAPPEDSVIEAFVRFGDQGNATYYWMLTIGQ